MRIPIHFIWLFLVLGLAAHQGGDALAQRQDLSFVAAIKGSRFDQGQDGALSLTRYFFFTEIFLSKGGRATEATLSRVGSSEDPWIFEQDEEVLTFAGGYFPTLEELDAAFPGDVYALDVTTPSGALEGQIISFTSVQEDQRLPDPVTIHLAQDGKDVNQTRVDPKKALAVTWSDFTGGRADPNGIVDDLIFVIVTDSNGKRVAHSGRPFNQTPFLTYDAEGFEILPGSLEPDLTYTVAVEHARVLNTDNRQTVPVFASYATVTYLAFHTSGQ